MKSLVNERDMLELQQRYALLRGDEQPLFGTMSAGMAVCHVREAYRWAAADGVGTLPYKLPVPKAVIKRLALHGPMKWRPGVKTILELEPGQPGTVPADFAADKASLLTAMLSFRESAERPDHPFFGSMTHADWMRWGYLHADHHLRQFGR